MTPPNTELKSDEAFAWEFVNQGLCLAPLKGNKPTAVMEIVRSIQHNAMLHAAEISRKEGQPPAVGGWKKCAEYVERKILTRAEQILKGADKESLYDALRSDDHNKD